MSSNDNTNINTGSFSQATSNDGTKFNTGSSSPRAMVEERLGTSAGARTRAVLNVELPPKTLYAAVSLRTGELKQFVSEQDAMRFCETYVEWARAMGFDEEVK